MLDRLVTMAKKDLKKIRTALKEKAKERRANRKERMAKLNVASLEEEIAWVREKCEAIEQSDSLMGEIVLGHNDLLSGNILFGEGWDRVRLIDFEYGQKTPIGFDIGNHWCEYAGFDSNFEKGFPSPEKQGEFLRYYVEAARPGQASSVDIDRARREVCQFAMAAHLYWALWAFIQSIVSPIDFDFMEYAELRAKGYYWQKAGVERGESSS